MRLNIIFRGFNFSQDGPGNRLVYHLQGCNLHCPWCSNPESIPETGCMLVKGKLTGDMCPFGAISDGSLDRSRCVNCAEKPCTSIPNSAVQLSCFEMEIDDMVKEIERSSMLFFDGGGVTFTGGEPTVQFEGLKELLSRIKALEIHTAVETNGCHAKLPELFNLVDFLIIDCKHYDSELHKRITGTGNEVVLKNIKAALKKRSQLLVRIPLIGGFNVSNLDAERFAALFEPLNTSNCAFELLRYHEYGKNKWEQCGAEYIPENAQVSDGDLSAFSKVFETHGLKLVKT